MSRVRVRGYRRADGTWVRPHTRGAPAAAAGVCVLAAVLLVLWLLRSGGADSADAEGGQQITSHAGFNFVLEKKSESLPCSAHAYGTVQQYLVTHPCQALTRGLYTATNAGGAKVLVAVSWADMPSPAEATGLRDLANSPGTGNIAELSREIPAFSGTRFTGRYYDSRLDGHLVVIGQAEPLAGAPSGALLEEAARAAVTLPRA